MFGWTDRMIDFLADANEYNKGEYHRKLAQNIVSILGEAHNFCDAGCGIGLLSLALKRDFDCITAIDSDPKAVEVLKRRISAQGIANIIPVCANLDTLVLDRKFDSMLFSFIGSLEEDLRWAKKFCNGRIVIIKKAYSMHRFSLSNAPIVGETADTAVRKLKSLGIIFDMRDFSADFGQPFRNLGDAVEFFEIYKRGDEAVDPAKVEEALVPVENGPFRFYYPKERSCRLFEIDTVDIPEYL